MTWNNGMMGNWNVGFGGIRSIYSREAKIKK
jgi:hypothetical protein